MAQRFFALSGGIDGNRQPLSHFTLSHHLVHVPRTQRNLIVAQLSQILTRFRRCIVRVAVATGKDSLAWHEGPTSVRADLASYRRSLVTIPDAFRPRKRRPIYDTNCRPRCAKHGGDFRLLIDLVQEIGQGSIISRRRRVVVPAVWYFVEVFHPSRCCVKQLASQLDRNDLIGGAVALEHRPLVLLDATDRVVAVGHHNPHGQPRIQKRCHIGHF